MSKAIKIAAVVVGIAAVALTAGAALGILPAVLGTIGGITITTSALAAALGVAASALSVAAGLLAPKPGFGSLGGAGTQLDFRADPTAGMPYVMGNARVGESVVHEMSWGAKNKFLGIVGVLSCAGPIMAYDGFYADNTLVPFSGRSATGYYSGFLLQDVKTGGRPASVLNMTASDGSTMPDWGSAYLLSSLAASGLILTADVDNGKVFSGGVPQLTHQIRGVMGYDPRLDSTNGGSGTERPGGLTQAETGYSYSENPWVHHGTFALGRWVNGVRVIGPGVPSANIDWASHIEAANIADANGWTVSGIVLSSDNKWNVLQSIAQAGGGYPIPSVAKLSCLINTPRVSLETIEEAHVKGAVSCPQMSMRRDRLNGAIPKYREPTQAWQAIDGNIVRNSTYLAADGGTTKTKEIELPLVANKDQAAQLVAYEVANSRERSPIQVPLDLYWSQYKMGDCLTLNLPSVLLVNQKCVVIGREIDAENGIVTFTLRTEDDAKHSWALSVDGGTPASATVGNPLGAGDVDNLTIAQLSQLIADSYVLNPDPSTPVLTASESQIFVKDHERVYSDETVSVTGNSSGMLLDSPTGQPILDDPAGTSITDETGSTSGALSGLLAGTTYYVGYNDQARAGGAETYIASTDVYDVTNSGAGGALPYMHYVGFVETPASGSGGTSSGGITSPPGFNGSVGTELQ